MRFLKTALFSALIFLALSVRSFASSVAFDIYDTGTPSQVELVSSFFGHKLDLGSVCIVLCPIDGRGKVLGMVNVRSDKRSRIIFIDSAEWDSADELTLDNEKFRLILFHELIHVWQTSQGEEARRKIIKWTDALPYEKRPHEIQAYYWAGKMNEWWLGQ